MKSRNASVRVGYKFFEVPAPRIPRGKSLVHANPKIPMGEIPKGQYANMLRYFDILEIRILKGVFPCTRKSQNLDLRSPDMV
jgi:hypothetical protein